MRPKRSSSDYVWAKKLEDLFQDSWRDEEHLHRFRTRYVFRGMPDKNHELITAIDRLGSKKPRDAERYSLRNFKKYAFRDVVDRTDWHWLSIAQHYGLPTRLLDWTNSPLAALHFATCELDHFDKDGIIWAVDLEKVHEKLPKGLSARIEGKLAFTIEELDKAFREIDITTLDQLEDRFDKDFMLFFEPPSMDERIGSQYAVFSIMPRLKRTPQEWLCANPVAFETILIPANMKAEIRDRLDMLNATERVFFPGLRGLSDWLRRYYGPSPHDIGTMKRLLHRGSHLEFHRAQGGWEYVSRVGAGKGVTMAVFTSRRTIILVEQLRVPFGKRVIELPAGLVDDWETAKKAARRELLEETGYSARAVEVLCAGSSSPGLSNEINYLVKMTGAVKSGSKKEKSITVHEVPIKNAHNWLKSQVAKGKVIDLKVYSGLCFAG